jgi:hypothetical protein
MIRNRLKLYAILLQIMNSLSDCQSKSDPISGLPKKHKSDKTVRNLISIKIYIFDSF